MTKNFCDICGAPTKGLDRLGTLTQKVKEKVQCDSKAQIEMRVSFSFIGHSSGYGVPPDLCYECTVKLIHGFHKYFEHTYSMSFSNEDGETLRVKRGENEI